MEDISKEEILDLAKSFKANNEAWHYHLLTPTCQFNTSGKFAIFMENLDTEQVFVHHSDAAEMELSNTLSGMLHGKEVLKQSNTSGSYHPSEQVEAILRLVDTLDAKSIKWHHHVFFPGCRFNAHQAKYELVVENPEESSYLVSVTDQEPKEDLKQIEQRFYSQKML